MQSIYGSILWFHKARMQLFCVTVRTDLCPLDFDTLPIKVLTLFGIAFHFYISQITYRWVQIVRLRLWSTKISESQNFENNIISKARNLRISQNLGISENPRISEILKISENLRISESLTISESQNLRKSQNLGISKSQNFRKSQNFKITKSQTFDF